MKKFKRDINIKLGTDNSKREGIYQVLIIGLFFLLGARMTYLQAHNQEKYATLAERNRIKKKSITPPRGKIHDRNGNLIATNGSGYRLVYLNERNMDPEKISAISEITGHEESFIERRIKNGEIFPYTRENVILEDLDMETAHKLMERIVDYPYLQVQTYYKRIYEMDSVASHTIGYVRKISREEFKELQDEGYSQRDIIGKTGIEKFYDRALKGDDGHEYIVVDAGSKIHSRGGDKKLPVPGKDLHITIDMKLQNFIEEEFREGHYSGAFVALEAKTGKVLTIVSYPTYSLNMFSSQILEEDWERIRDDPQKPLTNKSIAGEYPPGSTFKAISALAFLKEGIDPNYRYHDRNGLFRKGKQTWRAWKRGGHGQIDMKKSLVESANTYYYELSDRIGWDPIYDTAKDFGLTSITQIDVPGERRGNVPARKDVKKISWRPGDTINGSIGQGYVAVTPIQLAMTYSAIANRGVVYRPRIGDKFVSHDGKIEEIVSERIVIDENKYTQEYYNVINDALIATVAQNNGTTRVLRTPGLTVAAKSGSAQNSQSKITHAWVAGYFPAEDPEIVFTVILEGAGGGGAIAGSMAKKFVDKYLEMEEEKKAENLLAENEENLFNRYSPNL